MTTSATNLCHRERHIARLRFMWQDWNMDTKDAESFMPHSQIWDLHLTSCHILNNANQFAPLHFLNFSSQKFKLSLLAQDFNMLEHYTCSITPMPSFFVKLCIPEFCIPYHWTCWNDQQTPLSISATRMWILLTINRIPVLNHIFALFLRSFSPVKIWVYSFQIWNQ